MIDAIFREYDIRGIVGEQLTDKAVSLVARSAGTYFVNNGARNIAVGFDARESSPRFSKILTEGLTATGCNVVLIGRVPTPVLYHTVYTRNVDGGVMITGSHNPADHNGFKICIGKQTLYGPQIQDLKRIAQSGEFALGSGSIETISVLDAYTEDILSNITPLARPVKVVVDAGNGMGGITSVPVYRSLGADVIELFTNPDSSFPNHAPDPAVPENLKDAVNAVLEHKADLGIAFDGDADRITVIDDRGRMIWGDELTTLFCRELLAKHPGSTVIGEVKCSQTLFDEIKRLGGTAVISKAGHSIVKAKMAETGALLAGEMSGHIFFADKYYGFDDACYAGARVLDILARSGKPLSDLLSGIPTSFSTAEIRLPCAEDSKFSIVERVAAEFKKTNEVSTIDGARIKFENGWGLVRASNTQAILVLRFEANSESDLAEIKKTVFERLENLMVVVR